MKGLLQIHHELLYNCKASAKTFQNFINSFKMQIWEDLVMDLRINLH